MKALFIGSLLIICSYSFAHTSQDVMYCRCSGQSTAAQEAVGNPNGWGTGSGNCSDKASKSACMNTAQCSWKCSKNKSLIGL